MRRAAAAAGLGCLAGIAWATPASKPPEPPYEAMTWPATLELPPTRGLMLARKRVNFEETTLEQVRGWASTGTLARNPGAPDGVWWSCYTVRGGGAPYRLWLLSDETGPGEHPVSGVIAQRASDAHPAADCPRLPLSLQPVSLDDGLWLGSPETDVQRTLGAPSHADGDWQAFDFERKVSGNGRCEGGFDLTSDVMTKIVGGLVVELTASQITDC